MMAFALGERDSSGENLQGALGMLKLDSNLEGWSLGRCRKGGGGPRMSFLGMASGFRGNFGKPEAGDG